LKFSNTKLRINLLKQVFSQYQSTASLNSVHPEIAKLGRDQGTRKILPQA
jgi:hypothetical protein